MEQKESDLITENELGAELASAYKTITELTTMLDRALNVIEKLTNEKLRVARDELAQENEEIIIAPGSPYIGSKDVMEMFGCSQAMSYKYLRAAGAASIGRKLVIKRAKMLRYAQSVGLKQA